MVLSKSEERVGVRREEGEERETCEFSFISLSRLPLAWYSLVALQAGGDRVTLRQKRSLLKLQRKREKQGQGAAWVLGDLDYCALRNLRVKVAKNIRTGI